MIEKCNIVAPGSRPGEARVLIDSTYVLEPAQAEDILGVNIESSINTREKTATLSLDYSKYILKLRLLNNRSADMWKVEHLSLNLARILFGHNSKLILTQDQLHKALSTALTLLNRLVEPEGKDRLIPGLLPDGGAYYNYLELANQIHDPGSLIHNSMKNGRLKFYDNNNSTYESTKTSGTLETIYFGSDSKPQLIAYRKDSEILQRKRKQFDGDQTVSWEVADEHKECLRIEKRLHARKLINTVLGASDAYEDGIRLTSFTIDDLDKTYARSLSALRGVFSNKTEEYKDPVKFKKVVAGIIYRLENEPNVPALSHLLNDLTQSEGKQYSKVSLNLIRKHVEAYLESRSNISIEQLLPSSHLCAPMQVEPMKRNRQGDLSPVFRPSLSEAYIHPRVAKAYSQLDTLNINHSADFTRPVFNS